MSLNEVGGEPDRFGVDAAEFHDAPPAGTALAARDDDAVDPRHQARRRRPRPHRRARRSCRRCGRRSSSSWALRAPPPDADTALFLWQTSSASGRPTASSPTSSASGCTPTPRRRSARRRPTTWTAPDEDVRGRGARAGSTRSLDGRRCGAELTASAARLDEPAGATRSARSCSQLTVPGMPDVYQGTELPRRQPRRPRQPAARSTPHAPRGAAAPPTTPPPSCASPAALRLRRDRPEPFRRRLHAGCRAAGPPGARRWPSLRGDDVLVAHPAAGGRRLGETVGATPARSCPTATWTDG